MSVAIGIGKHLKPVRIYLILRKILNRLTRGRYFIANRSGLYFLIDINNLIDRHIDAFHIYEPSQLRRFIELSTINKSDIFLDIGANSGMYSIHMAKNDAEIDIVAFEPDNRNISQLYGNLFVNGLEDRVHVKHFGLSDRNGKAAFNRFSDQNRGRSSVDSGGAFEIILHRADDVFVERGRNICIKIDVEGHELNVLDGAKSILRDNRCVIQIECFNNVSEMVSLLSSLGYENIDRIDNDYYFCKQPS